MLISSPPLHRIFERIEFTSSELITPEGLMQVIRILTGTHTGGCTPCVNTASSHQSPAWCDVFKVFMRSSRGGWRCADRDTCDMRHVQWPANGSGRFFSYFYFLPFKDKIIGRAQLLSEWRLWQQDVMAHWLVCFFVCFLCNLPGFSSVCQVPARQSQDNQTVVNRWAAVCFGL